MGAIIDKNTLQFLKDLKKNNNREWFEENRREYETARDNMMDFTDAMIREIGKFDMSIKGSSAKDSVFRIFRDTRFSKDKTPYKTNFGAFVKAGGKKEPGAGYYLHLEPGENFLGGGLYSPPPNVLFQIRTTILEKKNEYKKIIENREFKESFGEVGMDPVKTVPRGFDRENPDIALIRFKNYVTGCPLQETDVLSDEFMVKAMGFYRLLKPFNHFLNKIVGL